MTYREVLKSKGMLGPVEQYLANLEKNRQNFLSKIPMLQSHIRKNEKWQAAIREVLEDQCKPNWQPDVRHIEELLDHMENMVS